MQVSSWWVFTTTVIEPTWTESYQACENRIDSSLRTLKELCKKQKISLVRSVKHCQSHILCPTFPLTNTRGHDLRANTHNFQLPPRDDKCFVLRLLFGSLAMHLDDDGQNYNNNAFVSVIYYNSNVDFAHLYRAAVCQPYVIVNKRILLNAMK